MKCLHHLFETIWIAEAVPLDFKDATITHLFNCKGDRANYINHSGISLLSIAGKILARIINSRISVLAESLQPESQCGYRTERGTADMIFAVQQLQENFTFMPYKVALAAAGLPSMYEHRETITAKLFNDVISNPDHKLHNLLPTRNHSKSSLRNNRAYHLPGAKTNRLKNTVIYSNCR